MGGSKKWILAVAVVAGLSAFGLTKACGQVNTFDPKTVVFLGSSTIQFWPDLDNGIGHMKAKNLGIYGSDFRDLITILPEYLAEYPAQNYVVYSGDNDIAEGNSPEVVASHFAEVAQMIHTRLPSAHVFVISIKPCPTPERKEKIPEVRRADALIHEYSVRNPYITYVDTLSYMFDKNGEPNEDLFQEDQLHLNKKGYALWTSLLLAHLEPQQSN